MTLALPHLGTGDPDLAWLVIRIADLLGVPVEAVDPDAPLFELGLDSVTAVELTEELRQRLGVTVPDTLLYEHPSPRAALEWLARGTATCTADPWSDATLPAEIRPPLAPRPAGPPEHVLMTGATGFLGAHTLAQLLQTTEARVTCLVRGGDGARVVEALASRGLDGAGDRIEVLAGDLERPRLGLDPFTWARLGEEVDAVLHLAAKVDWVSPYAALRTSNAEGTRELLRLACEHRPKAFHFCSSISVLYARDGADELDEGAEPLEHLGGLDLGYAAGKAVAEELVLEAGRRGLPITIARPSLVAGDSRTGAGNPGDFLSALMKGCIELGLAPDLDWNVDAVPVDHVAAALAERAAQGPDGQVALHLVSPRPRPFREVVLWHALYGHDLRLVPYDAWLSEVEAAPATHALKALLPFLRSRPGGEGACTLPQQYEESRRTQVDSGASAAWLEAHGHRCPEPTTTLLERWTAGLESAGYLAPPPAAPARAASPEEQEASERAAQRAFVERRLGATRPGVERLEGSSILAELGAWRFGAASGLSRWHGAEGTAVLKARQQDHELHGVLVRVFAMASDELGARWREHGLEAGLLGAHLRETQLLADPALASHRPRHLGTQVDEAEGRRWLLMEDLGDLELMDSADRPEDWTDAHLSAAVEGLASIHAAYLGRADELEGAPWIGAPPTPDRLRNLAPFWRALTASAAEDFHGWSGVDLEGVLDELLEDAPSGTPRTLIHGDFNPRNVGFRRSDTGPSLVAYDWELATLDVPQRDLVELLAFVGPADPERWVEAHRVALERASGIPLDREAWARDAARARHALLVTRLTAYHVIHRARRQRFLPRTVRHLVQQMTGARNA